MIEQVKIGGNRERIKVTLKEERVRVITWRMFTNEVDALEL